MLGAQIRLKFHSAEQCRLTNRTIHLSSQHPPFIAPWHFVPQRACRFVVALGIDLTNALTGILQTQVSVFAQEAVLH